MVLILKNRILLVLNAYLWNLVGSKRSFFLNASSQIFVELLLSPRRRHICVYRVKWFLVRLEFRMLIKNWIFSRFRRSCWVHVILILSNFCFWSFMHANCCIRRLRDIRLHQVCQRVDLLLEPFVYTFNFWIIILGCEGC